MISHTAFLNTQLLSTPFAKQFVIRNGKRFIRILFYPPYRPDTFRIMGRSSSAPAFITRRIGIANLSSLSGNLERFDSLGAFKTFNKDTVELVREDVSASPESLFIHTWSVDAPRVLRVLLPLVLQPTISISASLLFSYSHSIHSSLSLVSKTSELKTSFNTPSIIIPGNYPIIPEYSLILFITYYSRNYSSILDACLDGTASTADLPNCSCQKEEFGKMISVKAWTVLTHGFTMDVLASSVHVKDHGFVLIVRILHKYMY